LLFGMPTRYGSMPGQWRAFWDTTGGLWARGAYTKKMATFFTSTASQHGGQETTALTSLTTLAHHGIIYVPLGFTSPHLSDNTGVIGGSAYGAGTITNGDGSRMPSSKELEVAAHQGEYFTSIVAQYVRGRQ
ncbi:flavo protein, partial [Basidiobolus meristosporus CBS 931.73]